MYLKWTYWKSVPLGSGLFGSQGASSHQVIKFLQSIHNTMAFSFYVGVFWLVSVSVLDTMTTVSCWFVKGWICVSYALTPAELASHCKSLWCNCTKPSSFLTPFQDFSVIWHPLEVCVFKVEFSQECFHLSYCSFIKVKSGGWSIQVLFDL